MDDLQQKLDALLQDPDTMGKIMAMARELGGSPGSAAPPQPKPQPQEPPQLDLRMVQQLSGLMRQSGIDQREQALLQALGAYLSGSRISRLEKAMRAAKVAKIASAALRQQGLLSPSGR